MPLKESTNNFDGLVGGSGRVGPTIMDPILFTNLASFPSASQCGHPGPSLLRTIE